MSDKKTALLILFLSLLIYAAYGDKGLLYRDEAIYVYAGERLAEGKLPYQAVFDHKGPLAQAFFGLSALLSRLTFHDPVRAARWMSFALAAAVPLFLFLLLKDRLGIRASFLASLAFLGFSGFSYHVLASTRPKILLMPFFLLSFLLLKHSAFFWAGLSASITTLIWQPMGVIVIAEALFIWKRGRNRVASFLAGVLLPLLILIALYAARGALKDLADGLLLFNLFYVETPPILQSIAQMPGALRRGFPFSSAIILIGLVFYPLLAFRNREMFAENLSFAALLLWTFVDFQNYPDFFPLLPFAATGFALMASYLVEIRKVFAAFSLALFIIALLPVLHRDTRLADQRKEAFRILKISKGTGVLALSAPQFLVLTGRKSPTRFIFIVRGIGKYIQEQTPGGLEGWLQRLQRRKPCFVVVDEIWGYGSSLLSQWLRQNFRRVRGFRFFRVLSANYCKKP